MALEGSLTYLEITHLFQVIGGAQKSGVLEITWEDRWARILFERGRLVNAQSNRTREGIGADLVAARFLTPRQLEGALELQRADGFSPRRLGAILCDELGVRPQDLERLLRRRFELIVFDVFSWPGGRFVFEPREPADARDRFHVDPMEFILGVGMEAGLLAEEGIEREKAGRKRRHVLLLDEDPGVVRLCREHWQRRGLWVTCCDDAGDLLEHLSDLGSTAPVVVVSETRQG
ncbi:MAG: DUF4388 domain-containing protein, partial [Deltaproteobacteria bacterium]|nr:DUF4388 domain-containing protein [Deltaproteobacteria bacterium]